MSYKPVEQKFRKINLVSRIKKVITRALLAGTMFNQTSCDEDYQAYETNSMSEEERRLLLILDRSSEEEDSFFRTFLHNFFERGGTLEYAQALSDQGYNFYEIYALHGFGLSPEQILKPQDSKLPNALIVLPSSDWNRTFYGSSDNFIPLTPNYDVTVVFAEDEGEIYRRITPDSNIELLVLSGHGTPESIRLRTDRNNREEYTIDLSDGELCTRSTMLNSNATISLNSCLTAAERTEDTSTEVTDQPSNLFHFIESCAAGKTVIGAREDIFPFDNYWQITGVYPFEVELYNRDRERIDVVSQ